MKYLPAEKAVLTGSPIRQELLSGNASRARELCGFDDSRPVLFIIGGSSGSVVINTAVRQALPTLLEHFQVAHMCGKGNLEPTLAPMKGYRQFEYIGKELSDIFAMSDIVVSRAGANSICELLALHKPNLLIPLSAAASRGDQILNAASFEKQNFSKVLFEENLTADSLVEAVLQLYETRNDYVKAMTDSNQMNSIDVIMKLIKDVAK